MKVGVFELIDPLPELKEPHAIAMLRPWIDVGNVGTIALTKLERHLGAKELGRIARPGNFYDFTRYRPIMRTTEGNRVLNIPNTIINYAVREEAPDLLFFHLLEPQSFGEDYTDSILEVIDKLGVKQYVRIGGMYDAVPHTRPLLVTGSTTGEAAKKYGDVLSLRPSSYQGPTSIVNLVAEGVSSRNIEAVSVMVHLPQYVQLEEDYSGAARLLEVLCSVYNLSKDLFDPERGRRQYREINNEVMRNQGLKTLIERLEVHYDSRSSGEANGDEETTKLSPEVVKFLNEMGERFDR
ncbi:MAG: PAC2 family protein [Dehalococcoidia bacterium]|nr:PAC2 family protein [Chloroflexota bacterium]MCZ6866149.1 PAC2 family protein [Chloroflexota bacterium]